MITHFALHASPQTACGVSVLTKPKTSDNWAAVNCHACSEKREWFNSWAGETIPKKG